MCFFRFKERKNMLIQHCYISISVSCNLWSSLMERPKGHLSATKRLLKNALWVYFLPRKKKKKDSLHFHPYKLKTAAARHWGFNCTTKAEFSACWVLVMALPVCPSAETLNWALIMLASRGCCSGVKDLVMLFWKRRGNLKILTFIFKTCNTQGQG